MNGKKERCYIIGPMRGLPSLNFPAFEKAAARLRAAGFDVTSPHEQDIEAGYGPTTPRPLVECAPEDVSAVLASDVVAVLPNWETSRMGRVEVFTALAADKPIRVIDAETLEEIKDPVERLARVVTGTATTAPLVRQFETGATRDVDTNKFDYEGFLSPIALEAFANYMHKHRRQADGSLRASDNWQKGIPLTAYVKSAWRHFMEFWKLHRGYETRDEKGNPVTMEDAITALLFNLMGYLHEFKKAATKKVG